MLLWLFNITSGVYIVYLVSSSQEIITVISYIVKMTLLGKSLFPTLCFAKGSSILRLSVSTWTPLASAFNTRPKCKMSLNFSPNNTGLFGIPELCCPEGFYELKNKAISEAQNLVFECCKSDRKRKMVELFDELSDTLCRVADLAEFIRIADPREEFARAAEDTCISISGIVEKLNTNHELYAALRNVVDNGDKIPTTSIDDHVSRLFLFDFEQCGIHLPENQRHQVVQLNDAILQLGQQFVSGALSPRVFSKTIIPEHLRKHFSVSGNQIVVTGLVAESPNQFVRELSYKVYFSPDERQESVLLDLLASRYELAKICGFRSYGERALKSSIAKSPDMVFNFLDNLCKQLKEEAEKDYSCLRKMKQADGVQDDLRAWDVAYYGCKAKQDWLQVGTADYSHFLSLGACMEGLDLLLRRIYGISLENVQVEPGEAWADDVYKLAVVHETEGLLGHVYCDFYGRPGKPQQDCHFTIRGGRELRDGSYQNPVVVLMLNLPSPTWVSPSLLTPAMMDNLFHEMGHAMHSMLGRTKYQHVTGTRCSTDFAEVPSILMEYFSMDPRVVGKFAHHFRTREKMPAGMLARMCSSKHLLAASDMQAQAFYSALDQEYHGASALGSSPADTMSSLQRQYYSVPPVPGTAWYQRFSHLVGYGAKYYAYLLSQAVASWIWQQHFEGDPLDRAAGERYRRECLAHGGGKPEHELVADFLGKQVTPANLSRSLINEIHRQKEKIESLKTLT
ncbi:mitochondrial intermediate peptidase [Bacillus rossius redtenbacheri]|uniref:mitochondrial intermediate peptidase n=1 Tax=Bacillus rossius redtenbacheri TaxID=93214 RepID=UPI002FDEC1F6